MVSGPSRILVVRRGGRTPSIRTRRSTFTDRPVTYAAVGGTLAPDLVQYPPQGYRPEQHSVRLGSGAERFETSVAALMTWGVQTGSGIEVTDIDQGTGEQYAGVRFDDDGNPAELQEHRGMEAVFDDSGAPYIGNGMTAVLHVPVGPFRKRAAVRVVYIVDEPHRVGFAYGTLHGHPESGEEAFIVEHRDDDSVWFVLRSFSRGSNVFYRMAMPLLRAQQRRYTKRYLRALHPVSGT